MRNPKKVLYSFDRYLLEVAERRLWRDKELLSVTPKAFDTLVVLLENRGRIVEKDVLLSEVWQDTFVEESTLAQNISTLRKTLGTLSNDKQFIETVPRHGYRFVADVKEITGDEEIIVLEHHKRTEISAEHKRYTVEAEVQTGTDLSRQTKTPTVSLWKEFSRLLSQNKLRFGVFTVFGCLILAAVVGAIVKYSFLNNRLSTTEFSQIQVTKLTSNGNINLVTISPDGKYLALVEQRGENQALLLRQIDNSQAIEIAPPKKQKFIGLTFSSDGQSIFYASYDFEKKLQPGLIGNLYKIPVLGGSVQHIAADVDSPITISPDGRQFAFIRNYMDEKQSALMTAYFDNSGGGERKLAARAFNESFSREGLAFSPDGKTIAATAYAYSQEGGRQMEALTVNASDGEQKPLTSERWKWIASPNWLKDGSGLVFVTFSGRSGDQADEIYQISYPEGTARKITGGVSGIYGLGLTADSKFMVAVKSDRVSSFWTSSAGDLKQAAKITQNLTDYNLTMPGIAWTSDGKIIYGATLNGNLDVWMMDADGSHKRQITVDNAADSMPFVSKNGQDIFFISNRSGRQNLWRMKIDGSEQKQLTDGDEVSSPGLSADGNYIFYAVFDRADLQSFLHKISIVGGASVQLTSQTTILPTISPDGKWIACYYPGTSANDDSAKPLKLTILSAEDGKVVKQFASDLQYNLSPLAWSDNETLNYLTNEGDGSRLWQQSLDKDSPQMILDSPTEKIFRFAWSLDGRKLVYEKGTAINDIILINSIKNRAANLH